MVNDGSQEARNPKSGFDTRSACRDDLDSACANSGDEWEKAHTSCQLGSGGLGGFQLRHIGAEEAQKERRRGARSGVPVELELELSETQISRDSRRETCRFAAELPPNAICGPIQPASPPRQVSQQSSAKQASEGDESDESLRRTAANASPQWTEAERMNARHASHHTMPIRQAEWPQPPTIPAAFESGRTRNRTSSSHRAALQIMAAGQVWPPSS